MVEKGVIEQLMLKLNRYTQIFTGVSCIQYYMEVVLIKNTSSLEAMFILIRIVAHESKLANSVSTTYVYTADCAKSMVGTSFTQLIIINYKHLHSMRYDEAVKEST